MTRRLRRRLVLLLLAASLLAVPAGGPTRPLGLPAPAQVSSRFERAAGASLARDCGFSQLLPASKTRSLWLFCDTPVYVRRADAGGSWALKQFIGGSTAAVGPAAAGHAPGLLSELPTPGRGPARGTGGPAPFLPAPAGLATPAGEPCDSAAGAYAASWASGVSRVPHSTELLITFNDYCVLAGPSPVFLHKGFGLVQYDPAANTLGSEVRPFAGVDRGAAALQLGSPVFAGSHLFLFGASCAAGAHGGCTAGTIAMARVDGRPLSWAAWSGYQWWSGSQARGWTSDPAGAGSIIARARPYGVNVADFSASGRGLVLIEQTDIGGGFTVYQSRAPTGPWRRITSGRVPCGASRDGPADLCRAIIGHPELSTRSLLVLSYFDPGASGRGHVVVDAVAW